MKAAALVLLLSAAAAGCGDDDETVTGPVDYEVVMVVGAAIADDGADPSGFPGEGTTFTERWTLDCDDGDACTLTRSPAPPLGTLETVRLTPATDGADDGDGDGAGDALEGQATGVTAEPDPAAPGPCEGSAAERWTITVELTRDDDLIVGSIFRVPDALVDGNCFGLDLTLGFSGTPLAERQ